MTPVTTPALVVVRLDKDLPLPRRAHPHDGAVDLMARQDQLLQPGQRVTMPTGIAVAVPVGWAGWVIPRSGLAARAGLSIVNAPGLVDAGYQGEVCVVLVNLGEDPISISRGDRIAQLALTPVLLCTLVEADDFDESTSRGAGGFGSSGVHTTHA